MVPINLSLIIWFHLASWQSFPTVAVWFVADFEALAYQGTITFDKS
jgi:hypothetical protein